MRWMGKQDICLSALLVWSWLSFASNENSLLGARGWAMGGASVTFGDLFSVSSNQAGLARVKFPAVGIYSEQRFLSNALHLSGAIIALPTRSGVFGLSVSYFGFSLYNEKKVGLAFAKQLTERFYTGIQIDYLNTFITEYGSRTIFTFEVGVQALLTDKLMIGTHVYNPVRATIGVYQQEKTPAVMKLGLGYTISEKILLCVETEKDIDLPFIFKAGMEYRIIEILYLRAGISTNPVYNTFGIGLYFNKVKIDIASSIHQTLGYTPHLSFSYEWNKK